VYEVQPGLPCYFAQEVATLCPETQTLAVLGTVNKKLVCLPDFSASLLGRRREGGVERGGEEAEEEGGEEGMGEGEERGEEEEVVVVKKKRGGKR